MSTSSSKYLWIVGVAVVIIGVTAYFGVRHTPPAAPGPTVSEGSTFSVSVPTGTTVKGPVTATFTDAGPHGWHPVSGGAAIYMGYDSTTGLTYDAPATQNADGSYSVTAPQDACGYIIQSSQEANAGPKVLQVTLKDADGKVIAGASPSTYNLVCDKYTLNVKIKASKDPVLPDGADQSIVTANLSVTGPAQFINGTRIKPGQQKITLTTPLGLVMVHFNNSLGVIAPSPANVKTDLAGDAIVTVSSSDAGIDKVQAQATGIGDAIINVHFPPKLTGVSEVFVPPTSPTNYQMATIPANPKDLTFEWAFLPAPGNSCGHMTGPLSGLSLSKNGFYHGPEKAYPNGCPEDWEHASQVKVTVTDKDGQSDTKTFSARAFEGQGVVKLP
jgi:hypothetical protein